MVIVPDRTKNVGKLSPRSAALNSPKGRQFRIISTSEVEMNDGFKTMPTKDGVRAGFMSQDRGLVLGDDELGFDYARWRKGWSTGFLSLNMHKFPNPKTELFFWNYYENKHKNLVRLYVLVLTVGTIFCIPIFDFDENLSFEERIRTLLVRCAQLTWALLYGILFLQNFFDPYNMEALFVFNIGLLLTFLFLSVIGVQPNHGPYVILILVVHLFCGLGNKLSSIFAFFVYLGFSAMAYFIIEDNNDYILSVGYLTVMLGMSTAMGQYLEFNTRKIFYKKHKLKLERARSDAILNSVLPSSIANHLKKGEKTFAREHKYSSKNRGVSVMFVQICNFEEKTSDFPVSKLVTFLNSVFSHFDDLTEKWEVFKVETVGEVYMAAAGLPSKCIDQETQRPDHARRLADLAIDIKKFSGHLLNFEYKVGAFRKFQIRIGLNSGTVIAGVIGRRLPRYRLIGDTVNVASRMESTAKPGTIQATIEFCSLLPNRSQQYDIVARNDVFVKGKGKMTVFVIKDGKMPRHQASRRNSSRRDKAMDVLSFLQEGRRIHAPDRFDMLSKRYQSDFLSMKREMTITGLELPSDPRKYLPPPPPPSDSEDDLEDSAPESPYSQMATSVQNSVNTATYE